MANLSNINNKFLVTTGGNVGIGVTGPLYRLEVSGSDFNFVGKFQSTGTGYAPASILLESTGSASRGQGMYHYNTTADENWFTGVPYNVNSKKWIVANQYSTSQLVDTAQLTHALMTIDSDTGNVGIGTTSPNQLLELSKNGSPVMRLNSSKTTNGAIGDSIGRIEWRGSNNAGNGAGIKAAIDTSATSTTQRDFDILFKTGNNIGSGEPPTRMRIDADGNVGIGTDLPDSLLHLASSFPEIRLEDSAYATNHYSSIDGNGGSGFLTLSADSSNTAANSAMIFKVDATETMRIDNSGNLLLNQATSRIKGGGSTTGRLELSNSDSKSYMMITGSTRTSDPNLIYFVNDAAVTLTLNQDNSATFARNVACGNPAGANTGVRIYYGAGTGDYGSIRFYSNAINTNTIHVFSDTWQSGTIFTKSSGAINIDGNTGVTFGAWSLVDVAFKSGGPNYFRGNVGINKVDPSYKLDVEGDVRLGGTNAQNYPIKMGRDNHAIYLGGPNINTMNVGWDTNSDYNLHLNYNGYAGGVTQFRNLVINDGKQGHIATFDGSSGNVSVGDTTAQRRFNVIDPTDAWIRISSSNYASDWLIGTAGSSASFKIYSQSAAALRFNIDGIGRMGFNYGIETDVRHYFYSNNNTGAATGVAKNVQIHSTQYAGTHVHIE